MYYVWVWQYYAVYKKEDNAIKIQRLIVFKFFDQYTILHLFVLNPSVLAQSTHVGLLI